MRALSDALNVTRTLDKKFLRGRDASVCLADFSEGSSLGGRTEELHGRSVLIAPRDQFLAALALIELDGIAQRVVLCPADLPVEHLRFISARAEVDAVVSDHDAFNDVLDLEHYKCTTNRISVSRDRTAPNPTEWILLTSGTTGPPKLVVHTLASLIGAIQPARTASSVTWSTFYDIRRYGGLQIFLRAILTGSSLVLSSPEESTADFLSRAGACGVTHISGTPSHWRRALMSPAVNKIAPEYVRLSGEIADQTILTHLQSVYPQSKVAHAFASTEAGVAFEVTDGLAGFPAAMLGTSGGVQMKIEDDSLRIRSARIAERYLGSEAEPLVGPDGFVDTRDLVERREDRYYFVGRRDGVINVGGQKVHPEEVEAVINRHPRVQMSLVRTRKSPITGALVVADVVLNSAPEPVPNDLREIQQAILMLCRQALPSHKIPASINFVSSLAVAATGKLVRQHA